VFLAEQVFGVQSRDKSRDGASVGIPRKKLASSKENRVMTMPYCESLKQEGLNACEFVRQ
jgi:hypothetical protein